MAHPLVVLQIVTAPKSGELLTHDPRTKARGTKLDSPVGASYPWSMPQKSNLPQASPPELSNKIDILELLRDGRHFSQEVDGKIHIIDSLTGLLVCVLNKSSAMQASPGVLVPIEQEGRTIYVESGLQLPTRTPLYQYNPVILDMICNMVASGQSLSKVCALPGFPSYSVLCRWRRDHPEVNAAIENARRDRAEVMRDAVLEQAERTMEDSIGRKDEVAALGVLLDATKWATGIDNEKFNPKAKVEATVNVPTQIIVHTGINRNE